MSRTNNSELTIVLLSGKKQTGKNTAADALVKHGFQEFSFAAPLKKMCANILSTLRHNVVDALMFEDNTFKQAKVPHAYYTDAKYDVTHREVLQLFGTEFMRNYLHHDVWVHICAYNIIHSHINCGISKVVITDCRFANEIEVLSSLILSSAPYAQIKTIRIERAPVNIVKKYLAKWTEHISETALDFYKKFDAVIYNDGSVKELHAKILKAVKK